MLYTERNDCRLCNGQLSEVLNLGDVCISTFLAEGQPDPEKAPLQLMVCDDCNLVQLRHTVNPDVMYDDYWYQSGLNASMVAALRDVAVKALSKVNVENGDIFVDIGSNDGTLFRQYPEHIQDSVTMVGFEPTKLAQLSYNACDVLFNTYFNSLDYLEYTEKKAKIITSIAMFYDLENPRAFIDDIKDILHPDGVWVVQMMDLISMLKTGDFPNMCHEHLIYYSLENLLLLLETHELEIFDLEYNSVNGSSLRVYVGWEGHHNVNPAVAQALEEERAYFAKTDQFRAFRLRVEHTKDAVNLLINGLNQAGAKVAVMGASTKGNTILQYFGLDYTKIHHAAEVNPDKFGLRTVGTHIPIISDAESLKSNPDFYLVLPWGFLDNFMKRYCTYLEDGGAFIVPLPYPRIIR